MALALLGLLFGSPREPTLRINADEENVAQLGAVASYGTIVAPLQAAWLAAAEAEPARLHTRFDTRVTGLLIFMEVHRRILGGQFDRNSGVTLADAATAATTAAVVMPKCWNNCAAGADSPNDSMPTIAPSRS